MRVIGRLLVALAVAFPLMVVLAAGANGATNSGTGPAAMKCMHWEDQMNVSPGVSNTPANQVVTAHGKVFGCNKLGGGGKYSATLEMAQATCGNLAMSGSASFDWVNGMHSTAYLLFHPQALEPAKVYVNGQITSGAFEGLTVSAWLRFSQVFDGSGANCSPSNTLQHITFTNSQSFQLLTPTVTTTSAPAPTTTQSTPTSAATTTTPITSQGSTSTPPTNSPPVTIFQNGGGGGGGVGGLGSGAFPEGTLAFTGSRSGLAATFGFEALLIGGALAFLDPERKRRKLARFAYLRHRPKSFLQVTLPPMR